MMPYPRQWTSNLILRYICKYYSAAVLDEYSILHNNYRTRIDSITMTSERILLSDFIYFNSSFPTRLCWLHVNTALLLYICLMICVMLCFSLLLISRCLDISEWIIDNCFYNGRNDLDESMEFTNEISDMVMAIIREGISILLYVCGTIISTLFTGLIINDTALLRWLIESISITCLFTLYIWVLFYIANDIPVLIPPQLFSFINKCLSFVRLIIFIIMRCIDLIDVYTPWFDGQLSHLILYCENLNYSYSLYSIYR
jgi:hypothetical protein